VLITLGHRPQGEIPSLMGVFIRTVKFSKDACYCYILPVSHSVFTPSETVVGQKFQVT